MASGNIVATANVIEDSAAALLARVTDVAGNIILQDGIASMMLKVFEMVNATTGTLITPAGATLPYTGTALNVADVVFNVPQFDARWPEDPEDGEGFNFAFELHGSYFPEGNKTYQAEIKVTPAIGAPYYMLYQLKTTNIYSE